MREVLEDFTRLIGLEIGRYDISEGELALTLTDGSIVRCLHDNECCEYVRVYEYLNSHAMYGRILAFSCEYTQDCPLGTAPKYDDSYHTWSIVRIETTNGKATIVWLGESDGNYNETIYISKENA